MLFVEPYKPSPKDALAERRLELLDELEAMGTKRKIKEELMAEQAVLLRPVFHLAYDWRLTFGLRKIPKAKPKKGAVPGADERWVELAQILIAMDVRKLTGNDASRAVQRFLRGCSELEQKWYKRIITRDLRIGVGRKTINKVYAGLIPEWNVQVASKIDQIEHLKLLDYPIFYDNKLDGIRATVVVDEDGKVAFRTRSGHHYDQYQHVTDQLAAMGPGWYDGEMFAGRWNDTSAIMRLDPERPGSMDRVRTLKFHLFDLWDPAKPLQDIKRRRIEMLRRLHYAEDRSNIVLVELKVARSAAEAKEAYLRALNEGHEGIMLKATDGRWAPTDKRDGTWIKIKPFKTIDAVIVSAYEGRGRHAGRLGGFLVEYKGREIGVGGGYTDAMREHFWEDRMSYIGKMMEVKVQDDQDEVAAARFNVFQRMREDKS